MNANVPTRTGRASAPRRIGPLLIALTAILLVAAAPAFADHKHATCSYRKCNQPAKVGSHYNLPAYGVSICAMHRAYLRGYDLGDEEGRRQGYLDGFCGSYFDDSLPRTMRRRPLEFVEGYAQAYTTAYDINFERGKQARRNSYRRSRARRWHCWY